MQLEPAMSQIHNQAHIQVEIGKSYKVPFGFELPFAGRFLTAVKAWPGGVEFCAAGGNIVTLGNNRAELLASNATSTR